MRLERYRTGTTRQRGAIAVMVAISLVTLMLMIGLVLDLGHLYITKAELQSAADACALSAARELNDQSNGLINRATAAGMTAGNRHRIDLQSVDMRAEDMGIQPADVTFSKVDGGYSRNVDDPKYVRCAPRETNIHSVALWFMHLAGLSDWSLSASAVARLVPGHGPCAIPLAMCTTDPSAANLGFTTGNWYSGRLGAGTAENGNYGWIRFDGQGPGVADLNALLAGQGMCNLSKEPVKAKGGVSDGTARAWNTRFGLYSPGSWDDVDLYPPDGTGWAYTPDLSTPKGTVTGTWSTEKDAYNEDYQGRANITHDPFNLDLKSVPGGSRPLTTLEHAEKGQQRRLVFVPVISCADWEKKDPDDADDTDPKQMPVHDYACALMLAPINDPRTDVRLEFRGLMGPGDCASFGVPGNAIPGSAGLPVPALVR